MAHSCTRPRQGNWKACAAESDVNYLLIHFARFFSTRYKCELSPAEEYAICGDVTRAYVSDKKSASAAITLRRSDGIFTSMPLVLELVVRSHIFTAFRSVLGARLPPFRLVPGCNPFDSDGYP